MVLFCRKVQTQSMKDLMRKMRKKLTLMTMILKVILYSPNLFVIILIFYNKHVLFDFGNMNGISKLLSCANSDAILMADDEEDMLEHYLAEKSDSSSHSLRRAT